MKDKILTHLKKRGQSTRLDLCNEFDLKTLSEWEYFNETLLSLEQEKVIEKYFNVNWCYKII